MSMKKKQPMMKESTSYKSSREDRASGSNQQESSNKIKDYQNFLSCAPI